MATAQLGLQAIAGGGAEGFAIEFNLSSLPSGATINSAQLRLRTSRPDKAGQTTLAGYIGNGAFELSDVTTGSDLLTFTPPDQINFLDVTNFVKSVVAGANPIAGFNLRQNPDINKYASWDSIVQGFPPLLTIDYTLPNSAPTASDDSVSTSKNTAITVDLSDNLIDDKPLSELTFNISNETNGKVTLIDKDTQKITFTPNNGFSGTASFSYTVTDADGATSTPASVKVEVGDILSVGNKGQDVSGNEGNDYISGGNGKDTIRGLGGKDVLLGNNGNDTLIGGKGNDSLTGGNGADRFVLAAGEDTDTITDFKAGTDLIGLAGGLSFSNLTFSGNNILNDSEVLATLMGINTSTLTQSNFTTV